MSPYSLSDLYGDLLEFAANHLRIGGRLVFWLPVYKLVLPQLRALQSFELLLICFVPFVHIVEVSIQMK